MALSKEVYTVVVLFIQYAFPLASIAFAYSRIAHRMGTRFVPRNSSLQPSTLVINAEPSLISANDDSTKKIKRKNDESVSTTYSKSKFSILKHSSVLNSCNNQVNHNQRIK